MDLSVKIGAKAFFLRRVTLYVLVAFGEAVLGCALVGFVLVLSGFRIGQDRFPADLCVRGFVVFFVFGLMVNWFWPKRRRRRGGS
jgi:hypothetical protein